MKITHRAGHNEACPGSKYYVDEVVENRKIHNSIIKYLSMAKHSLIDCTPHNISGVNEELNYGISSANNVKGDIFFSTHLNCYEPTEAARGAEVLIYPGDKKTRAIGERILKNLENVGFKNRGVKEQNNLAELNSIYYSSMIIECFFVDSKDDVELYKKLGADIIGKAIAEGIHGTVVNVEKSKNIIVINNEVDRRAALYLADYLNCNIIEAKDFVPGIGEKVYVIGGGINIPNSIVITGKDRYDTCNKVLDFIIR